MADEAMSLGNEHCNSCGTPLVACFAGADRPRNPDTGAYYINPTCPACEILLFPIPAGYFEDIENIGPTTSELARYLRLAVEFLEAGGPEEPAEERVRLVSGYCWAWILRKSSERANPHEPS